MNTDKKRRILKRSNIQHFILECNDIEKVEEVENVVLPLKISEKFADNYDKIVVEHNGKILNCVLDGNILYIFYPKIDNNDNIIYLDFECGQSTFLKDTKQSELLYESFDFI